MAGAIKKTMLYLGLAEEDQDLEQQEYTEDYPVQSKQDQEHMANHEGSSVTPITKSANFSSTQSPDLRRITTVHPKSYNDARTIGEAFRGGIPVIMNLTGMSDADAKRLVDFAAGLVFGLHGAIEKVTAKVFLLSPSHISISADSTAAPKASVQRDFYNQS